jgi:hypothetical protein
MTNSAEQVVSSSFCSSPDTLLLNIGGGSQECEIRWERKELKHNVEKISLNIFPGGKGKITQIFRAVRDVKKEKRFPEG